MKYPNLFSPCRIGKCEIPNRYVVPAMVVNLNTDGGKASERYIRYHEEKAKGGFGLIITEDYMINPEAKGYPYIAALYDESQIPSHKKFTDTIHKYDTKVFCQIYHPGRETNSRVNGGHQPVSCSPIPCPANRELPRELTVEEIHGLVGDFASTAKNVVKAGFDGVEIHGAHGYLIHEFLSANCNKRIDEYGGNYENRVRFLREVMQAVREAVGPDFPIMVRVSADELIDGGRSMFESRRLFRDIESWGADAINVSYGMYGTRTKDSAICSFFQSHGHGVEYAAEVKKLVKIPVITAAHIQEPSMAEDIIASGMADFIGAARESLADPHLPEKARRGEDGEIRHCIACVQGCFMSTLMGVPIHCLVNPELGYEFETDYTKAPISKRVMVIGGGIAGMEAARTAAIKGHHVELFEASEKLGGQFLTAAFPPFKGDFATLPAWQNRQLKKLGVPVHLNTRVTPKMVREFQPDKVILATGARAKIPDMPGVGLKNVFLAEDVLRGRVTPGFHVVVAGGGLIGTETAAYLGSQCQSDVTLLVKYDHVGKDMIPGIRDDFERCLERSKVKIVYNTVTTGVTEKGVLAVGPDGVERLYPCDGVVLAIGTQAENSLYGELKDICDVVTVGDAVSPRKGVAAMREGFVAGMNA